MTRAKRQHFSTPQLIVRQKAQEQDTTRTSPFNNDKTEEA